MLRVEKLDYGPPNHPPLQRNLSFSLSPGELLHITGPNGVGKSFLLSTLLGIYPKQAGSIHLGFSRSRYLPQMQNKAAHLPYSLGDILSFESHSLDAFENLTLLSSSQLLLGWNKASGGERQRTLLTRFFLQPGDLLVLDEPFNHLDLNSKERVQELLRETYAQRPSTATLLISHDDNPSIWMGGVKVKNLNLTGEVR